MIDFPSGYQYVEDLSLEGGLRAERADIMGRSDELDPGDPSLQVGQGGGDPSTRL